VNSLKEPKKIRSGKWKWLIFLVAGVVVLAGAALGFIIYVLDYSGEDIRKALEEVPVLSWFLPDAQLKLAQERIAQLESRLEESQSLLAEQEKVLEMVEENLNQKDEEIEQLTQQNAELAAQLEDESINTEEREEQLKDLASLYASMSASRAASIMENMTLSEAALLLNHMDEDGQSQILARMDPEFAAKLTLVMKESKQVADPDMAALQERLVLLMDSMENTDEHSDGKISLTKMVTTFEQMNPSQAAQILTGMEKDGTQFNLGRAILANMGESSRARVLEQMDPKTAQEYIEALSQ
jgi:flagellar motility protein MotE (MotC chaperone)